MRTDVIGIPRGTRLEAVVRFGEHWHIWIACKSRGEQYIKWQGTFLDCAPDGSVTRVTRDDAYAVDPEPFEIKGPD
jgi:hypothetical protein